MSAALFAWPEEGSDAGTSRDSPDPSGRATARSGPPAVGRRRSSRRITIEDSNFHPTATTHARRAQSSPKLVRRGSRASPASPSSGAVATTLTYLLQGSPTSRGASTSRSMPTGRSRKRDKWSHLPAKYKDRRFVHFSRRSRRDWENKQHLPAHHRRNTFFSPTPLLKPQPSPLSRQTDIAGRKAVSLQLLAQEYWTEKAEARSHLRPASSCTVGERLYVPTHDIEVDTRQIRRSSSAVTVTRLAEALKSGHAAQRSTWKSSWRAASPATDGDAGSTGRGGGVSASAARRGRKGARRGKKGRAPATNPLHTEPEDKMSNFEMSTLQPDSIKLIARVEEMGGSLAHKNPHLKSRQRILCSKGYRRVKTALVSRKMEEDRAHEFDAMRRRLPIHTEPDFPVRQIGGSVGQWSKRVLERTLGSTTKSLYRVGGLVDTANKRTAVATPDGMSPTAPPVTVDSDASAFGASPAPPRNGVASSPPPLTHTSVAAPGRTAQPEPQTVGLGRLEQAQALRVETGIPTPSPRRSSSPATIARTTPLATMVSPIAANPPTRSPRRVSAA